MRPPSSSSTGTRCSHSLLGAALDSACHQPAAFYPDSSFVSLFHDEITLAPLEQYGRAAPRLRQLHAGHRGTACRGAGGRCGHHARAKGERAGADRSRNTVASPAVVALFKDSPAITTPFVRRHDLIGATGVKRPLAAKVAQLAGRPMRLFETEEAALDWLTPDQPVTGGDGAVIGVRVVS